MGLTVNKQNKAFGIDIDKLYLRLAVTINFDGKVDIMTRCYASKDAYKDNPDNDFRVDGIQRLYRYTELDITDALAFAHNKITDELTNDVTETRTYTTHDSKGNETIQEDIIVVKEKFTNLNNVTNDYNSGIKGGAK